MAWYRTLLSLIGLTAISTSRVVGQEVSNSPNPTEAGTVVSRVLDAEVEVPRLPVLDRPDRSGFITARLRHGDRIRVLVDRTPRLGWLAIAPLSTAIVWIEESSLESGDRAAADARSMTAWVGRSGAVIRSGNPGAKLPGPPCGRLPGGTLVQLVDRLPLKLASATGASRWLAIVPPGDLAHFIRAESVKWRELEPARTSVAETRVSYEVPAAAEQPPGKKSDTTGGWPAENAAELERVDSVYHVILTSQPIERWHFETVRAGYRGLLNRAVDHPDLEDILRSRLARVTRHEQAARAARTIESVLAKSRRLDHEVASVMRDLARSEQARGRAFDAVGFIQPSARRVDGRKLFSLIGREGATVAYLDLPPGLDPEPYLSHRVGVRGQARFNEELGTRLITVRDLQSTDNESKP